MITLGLIVWAALGLLPNGPCQTGALASQPVEWTDFSGACLQPASLRRGETLVFTSPAKVLKAIERFQEDRLGGSCGPEFAAAFERLKWVLDKSSVLGDICGLEAYERIRAFHAEFIHYYVPELTREQLMRLSGGSDGGGGGFSFAWLWTKSSSPASNQRLKPIPRALRQFFINFAKQANAQCKQQLVNRLDGFQSNKSLVNSEDFAVIGKYRHESDRLGFLYALTKAGKSSYGRDNRNEFNELQMIDLTRQHAEPKPAHPSAGQDSADTEERLLSNDDGAPLPDDGLVLYLQVPFDDHLKRIKDACRRRFAPIYMELFAPVVKLNNLGYMDRANSKMENAELEEREDFARWFEIIQTCEVLKDIEILHDASAESALVDITLAESHLAERAKRAQLKRDQSNSATCSLGRDIKLLSREQAAQLELRDEVKPMYEPPPARVQHKQVAFTDRMWLVQQDEVTKQAREFESDIARIVSDRTSLLKTLREDLSFQLRLAFRLGKQQVLERDESAMLGRLVVFLERHQHLIRGFGIVISAVVIGLSFG